MCTNEKIAKTLAEIESPFSVISGLPSQSSYYVDVDEARDGKPNRSVRDQIVLRFKLHSRTEGNKKKILLCGHRSCGKTTELRKIADALENCYYVIFLEDLDQQLDRYTTEIDFLYYIISLIIEQVQNDESFYLAIEEDLSELFELFERKIFTSEILTTSTSDSLSASIEAGINGEIKAKTKTPIISAVLMAFSKIAAKAEYESETRRLYEQRVLHYSQEFKIIANNILDHLDHHAIKENKHLLIIADGLDKLLEKEANMIFHGKDDVLSQLNSNLIISFPVFLQYSPKYRNIIGGYDEKYTLSMIMVRKKDGDINLPGTSAIKRIIEARMDINLFENEKLLQEIIQKSGGNLRDLFRIIRNSAINSLLSGEDKISKSSIEDVYGVLRQEFFNLLNESNIKILKDVYAEKQKKIVFRKDENDNSLMALLNSDLIIEYTGTGDPWFDLHPLVADIIKTLH